MVYFRWTIGQATVDSVGQEKVTLLLKEALSDVPHHKGMLVVVDYLPGQSSIVHKHPGSVFAYVLEGSVISQLKGQKPMTYHAGQYWYESPMMDHLACKNASDKVHAKILVWQLVPDGDKPLIPVHFGGTISKK